MKTIQKTILKDINGTGPDALPVFIAVLYNLNTNITTKHNQQNILLWVKAY